MSLADANVPLLDVTENLHPFPVSDIGDLDPTGDFERYIKGEENSLYAAHILVMLIEVRPCGRMCGN